MSRVVVALNAGSSSLKFGVYEADAGAERARGTLADAGGELQLRLAGTKDSERTGIAAGAALAARLDWLFGRIDRAVDGASVAAVAHRIVHGGARFAAPARIDASVRAAIADLVALAPLHQPANLAAIDRAVAHWPRAAQVACFDTAFHRSQPRLAQLYALPRALTDGGILRYGFHGLSYESVARRLPAVLGERADGRVVVAHLGSGASLCAMRGRRSVACTMGYSPLEGVPMGTRSGDVDPGVVLHLLRAHGQDVDGVERVLSRESGLLGVSGLSADVRELEASESPHAREALDLFAYRVAGAIAQLGADLDGIDAIVFTGGIGEHGAAMRRRILDRCTWLGVRVDDAKNAAHAERFDAPDGTVALVRLVADEEAVLADAARRYA